MKKILFITYFFPPASLSAAQRSYSFIKHIDKTRFSPLVLTPKYADSPYQLDKNYNDQQLQIPIIRYGGISLDFFRNLKNKQMASNKTISESKKPNKLFSLFNSLLFPDKGMFWIAPAIYKAIKIIKKENIQYIHSTSPLFSAHIVAYFSSLFTSTKWILDIRDFHYLHHPKKSSSLLHKWWEKKILTQANHITFVTESMCKEYKKAYPFIEKKSSVIYNGLDIADFDNTANNTPSKPENKKIIFYAGTFYNGLRSPFPLFDAVEHLLETKKLNPNDLEIIIAGNIETELLKKIEKKTVYKTIKLLGALSRTETIKQMQSADFLWLIIPDIISHSHTIPVKLFEYLGVHKPVLAFVPDKSEAAQIIERTNTGTVFSLKDKTLENSDKLLNCLTENIHFSKVTSVQLQPFLRSEQAEKLEKIIEEYA